MEWIVGSSGLDGGVAGNAHQNGVKAIDGINLVTAVGATPPWIQVDIRFLHPITAIHLWDDSNSDPNYKIGIHREMMTAYVDYNPCVTTSGAGTTGNPIAHVKMDCTTTVEGRHIWIERVAGTDPLTIDYMEVEVLMMEYQSKKSSLCSWVTVPRPYVHAL